MKLKLLESDSLEQLKQDIDRFRKILIFKNCHINKIEFIQENEDGKIIHIAGVAYCSNEAKKYDESF